MQKTTVFLIMVLSLLSITAYTQHENVLYKKMKMVQEQDIQAVPLFQKAPLQQIPSSAKINRYTLLELNTINIQTLLSANPEFMSCAIPFEGNTIEVQLEKVNITAPGFTVITDKGPLQEKMPLGLHYRGVVKGSPESLVSISVFDNEIMGLISSSSLGNLTIGKLKDKSTHIIYPESFSKDQKKDWCGTVAKDRIAPYTANDLTTSSLVGGKCVNVYIEVSDDIVVAKGDTANTINYITGLFAQSATLYAIESVNIQLSQIFLWTTPSPYNDTSSAGRLSQFQATRKSFTGDVAHLVDLGPYGSIAHGFNAFCGTTIEKMCYSGIDPTYSAIPAYSWSVSVFTHEMGHLFGSRHTHACVWNGDSTAIDGCAPTEWGCALPSVPAGGGTIMSYCHLVPGVGINFSKGFGPQPGNVIRNKISGATCLNACPTCQSNVIANTPINTTSKYEVSNFIVGSSTVSAGSFQSVVFDAGAYVQLDPGFESNISSNGYFKAYIAGCGGTDLRDATTEDARMNVPFTDKSTMLNTKDESSIEALQVFPNPFTNKLTINYTITNAYKKLSIEIFSMAGIRIAVLQRSNKITKGKHSIDWDASDFSSGMYIIVLTTDTGKKIEKVVKL